MEKRLIPGLKQKKSKGKVGPVCLPMSERKDVLEWGHVKRTEESAGRRLPLAPLGTIGTFCALTG